MEQVSDFNYTDEKLQTYHDGKENIHDENDSTFDDQKRFRVPEPPRCYCCVYREREHDEHIDDKHYGCLPPAFGC